MKYDRESIARFETYFVPPKPKPGRPRKKKRGRPKLETTPAEKKQCMINLADAGDNSTIDLTQKDLDQLDARLEGVVSRAKRDAEKRINWDVDPYCTLRKNIADSWVNKNNLYTFGDSFNRFCWKMGIDRNVLKRYLNGKYKKGADEKQKTRGRPTQLSPSVMRHLCEGNYTLCVMLFHNCMSHIIFCVSTVVKFHDDRSEGLTRQTVCALVRQASGNSLTREQSQRTWDKTIQPLGYKLGLLTKGYVRPQDGTSKRTAAGSEKLQRSWHLLSEEMITKVRDAAMEILQDEELVEKMMPFLIWNMDEENVNAMGKNVAVKGSATKRKHDNQNASSRQSLVHANTLFPFCF